MRKLETRDEPVTIGFLGGSITSGEGAARPKVDGYRFIFEQWLNRAFPKESRHQVVQFDEMALSEGSDAMAMAFVQVSIRGQRFTATAKDTDTLSASFGAIVHALNIAVMGGAR